MMPTNEELEQRIQEIENYIELGEKLESIIDDEKDATLLAEIKPALHLWARVYKQTIEHNEKKEKLKIEIADLKKPYIKKYADIFGSEEKAAKYFDTPISHPLLKAYGKLVTSNIHRILAYLIAPFSERYKNQQLETYEQQRKSMQNFFTIADCTKNTEISRRKSYLLAQESEFREAKFAEELQKRGISEEQIAQIIERQEIILFCAIENLKKRYAPWM